MRIEAYAKGGKRADVLTFVRSDENERHVHTDELNLVREVERATWIAKLPESLRPHAELAGNELGGLLAQRQAVRLPASKESKASPFEELEFWPMAVSGQELLDDLREVLEQHVVLPQHASIAIALWICHTYVTDVSDYTPYILVTSPVRECGKTTLLEILQNLAFHAQRSDGITAAALYRRIDRLSPTMLLDELDTRLRGDGGETLRGVLNSGFQRGGKLTICVGDAHEDRDFNTFCPKVLSGIGRVWDTVTSRSIPVRLSRASKVELKSIRKIRGDRLSAELASFRRRSARWAADAVAELQLADPVTPSELGARQCDIWRPLLAIAEQAGSRWANSAREAALQLHGVAEDEGDNALLLLGDVHNILREHRGAAVDEQGEYCAISSAELVRELVQMEDRPWPEYRRDAPLSTRGLATLLGRFGVKPKTVRLGRGQDAPTLKGYRSDELAGVFKKYLPEAASEATQPSQAGLVLQLAGVTDVTCKADDAGEREEMTCTAGSFSCAGCSRFAFREPNTYCFHCRQAVASGL
ncbi:MAG TPA: DUF3631 domain-containing protein [Gemmatimonadaceae bacterium]|nr:DUF3631 domain-containing protein [Gemmatimonadaceae bacterium]